MQAPPASNFRLALDIIGVVGTIASLFGWLFSVQAKRAANRADKSAIAAQDAAEQARAAALIGTRRRSLIEELEEASQLIQQVGNLLDQEEWLAVRMQTQKILGTCKSAMARWGDELSIPTRDGIVKAGEIVRSIAVKSSEYRDKKLSAKEKGTITATHMRAYSLIHGALGEARRNEERDGG